MVDRKTVVSPANRRTGRLPLVGVLALVAVLSVPAAVMANSTVRDTWVGKYPSSASYTSGGCYLCHGTGTNGNNFNAYGSAINQEIDGGMTPAQAIAAVEAADSDSDPTASSNLKEINANTQPGWTYGDNNTIYDDTGGVISSNQPPNSNVTGKLDPAILVEISDNAFTPGTVAPKLGTSVFWTRASGSGNHNVAEVGDIFRSGAATTGAINFLVTFSAGTFSYECEVHPTMIGVVRVKPKVGAAPTGLPFTVTWATSKTDSGTQFDVQYKVGSGGTWKSWLSNTATLKGVFGKNGSPVTVQAGKDYFVRIRSESTTASSGWSAQVKFTA